MEYSIKLTKEQLEIIMIALGELPLKTSLSVFDSINKQFIEQDKVDHSDGE